jgi:hypothetical protein
MYLETCTTWFQRTVLATPTTQYGTGDTHNSVQNWRLPQLSTELAIPTTQYQVRALKQNSKFQTKRLEQFIQYGGGW